MPLIPLHRYLPDRTAADAHPVSAITGLQSEVDSARLKIPVVDGWSGPTLVDAATGSGVARHAAVYLDASGVWQLAAQDAEATADGLLGLVITDVSANTATIGLPAGVARRSAWTWTAGGAVYLGSAGALTQTEPSSNVVRRVGYALTAQALYFAPSVALTLA